MDTSAWYALADAGDRWHDEATQLFGRILELDQRLVTSNHVIGESFTLLRMRLGHAAAQEFLRRVRTSAHTQRIFVADAARLEDLNVQIGFAAHLDRHRPD